MLLLQSVNTALLIDPSGQRQVRLSAEAGLQNIANAIFAPDGKRVVFASKESGTWRIFSITLDGQKRKTIAPRAGSSSFCLSPLPASR